MKLKNILWVLVVTTTSMGFAMEGSDLQTTSTEEGQELNEKPDYSLQHVTHNQAAFDETIDGRVHIWVPSGFKKRLQKIGCEFINEKENGWDWMALPKGFKIQRRHGKNPIQRDIRNKKNRTVATISHSVITTGEREGQEEKSITFKDCGKVINHVGDVDYSEESSSDSDGSDHSDSEQDDCNHSDHDT